MKASFNQNAISNRKAQRGDMLVNIVVGVMILGIIGVFGMPQIEKILTQSKIPSVSEDAQRYIASVITSTAGAGITPYEGINQAGFARDVRGSSLKVGDIAGQGTGGEDVRHGLGGGNGGKITITETGDTFSLTFANVANAACPQLATSMQGIADTIKINGTSVKVTDDTKTVTTAYLAAKARNSCLDGDKNEFVFTNR